MQSQRRWFDSLCPRQLLPVISFTKGLLPRTPVNQQKLYIQRKLKPFSGSRGARREGARKRFQLLLSPAAAAPHSWGPRPSPTVCAHRCSTLAGTSSRAVRQHFCVTTAARLKLPGADFKGKYSHFEAMKTNLRTSSRRAGAAPDNAWAARGVYAKVAFHEKLLLLSTASQSRFRCSIGCPKSSCSTHRVSARTHK